MITGIVAYGVTNVGLGFGVYLIGVSRTTAMSAALIGLAEIPLGPFLVWAFYAEEVGLRTIIGGTIIMMAAIMYLVSNRTVKREFE